MTAVPTNTTLIVIIMGVTLFLEIVEIRKHKHDTDTITRVDKRKARKNRQYLAIMSLLIKCRKRKRTS